MNSDPEVMRYFPSLLSADQSDLYAETMQLGLEERDYGFWAVELRSAKGTQGPFIGCVGLSVPHWNAAFTPCMDIGWRLGRDYWGMGYASEAARRVLDYSFNQLDLDELLCFASVKNLRSIAVMERLGMVRNAEDDFDHPMIDPDSDLRRHALYRMSRQRWLSSQPD
tara:strand:- start:726 stop:1226 length:501 start_codon:yes stop_codon:yes gene_type:complete